MIDVEVKSPSFHINFLKLSIALEDIFHMIDINQHLYQSRPQNCLYLLSGLISYCFQKALHGLLILCWINFGKDFNYKNEESSE